jgi:poly-gamma-glutamate capsule biosynthesis protein CapA/YwtB (metallophosphatase superfamily)
VRSARLAFLGDTLLGGTGQQVIDRYGYDYPLARIRHLWRDADLVVANHEGPLTRRTEPAEKADTGRKRYWYRADPESAAALAAAGVRLVSLANNHVSDFGPGGLLETMTALKTAGVAHCGAGRDAAEARQPVVLEVAGLQIGFLSVLQKYRMYLAEGLYAGVDHPGAALLDPHLVTGQLAELRARVDVCVVLVHWGRNYRRQTRTQRELAAILRAAGADLVVGHHPHVVQQIEWRAGTPVLYSLGNGPFGTPGRFHSGREPYGLVALVDVTRHRVAGIDVRPMLVDNAIVNYQPRPAHIADTAELLDSIGERAATLHGPPPAPV